MKRLLVLTCFATLATAQAGQKSMREYWEDVHMPFSAVESSFDKAECYQAERSFLACMMALSTAAGLDGAILTTAERAQTANPGFGAVKADFGPVVAVVPAPPKGESPAAAYKQQKDERTAVHQFWTRLYQNRAVAGEVDFPKILAWVKGLPDFTKREAVLSATVFNSYLGVINDPHTMVLPLAYVTDEQNPTSNNFTGIGARFKVTKRNGKNLIVLETPMEGSPALRAGLRPHDVLMQIDGVNVSGEDYSGAVEKIKGPKGTTVTLTVERAGKSLQLVVTRDVIKQLNVSEKVLTLKDGTTLGYVKLAGFIQADGCKDVAEAVEDLEKQGAKGLIFDLRDNGGGLLTQAVCIANIFLPKGKTVVVTKSLEGEPDKILETTEMPLTTLPLVTLINSRSASASEIVSGALQDHARSWLVGERSYGKATVQTQGAVNPVLAMRQTIARFYLPSGRTNQIEGVLPDFTAYASPHPTEDEKVAYREEDEYMALAPVGTPWQQPRAKKVAAIETCLDKSGQAETLFQDGQTEAILPEYQVLVAEDVLSCVLSSPKLATSSGFEIGNAQSWLFVYPAFFNFNLVVPGIGVL